MLLHRVQRRVALPYRGRTDERRRTAALGMTGLSICSFLSADKLYEVRMTIAELQKLLRCRRYPRRPPHTNTYLVI